MVMAALTALKSTNDDLDIVILWYSVVMNDCGSGMNRVRNDLISEAGYHTRREDLPPAANSTKGETRQLIQQGKAAFSPALPVRESREKMLPNLSNDVRIG